MPDDYMEVLVSLPAMAEPLRPIQVFSYPPTPTGSKPVLPNTVIEMFLHELSTDPHHNPFYCNRCAKEYILATRAEGTTCTQRPEGGFVCTGKITRRWTKEKAQAELQRLMAQGGVAIAWELGHPSVPIGLAVCEAHRSDTVVDAIDFPMNVLGDIYGRLGRDEPFLVFSHLSLGGVTDAQRAVVAEKLIKDAAESTMGLLSLSQATVLIQVSMEAHSQERQALDIMLGSKQVVLARDARSDRHRELWGFRFRIRND